MENRQYESNHFSRRSSKYLIEEDEKMPKPMAEIGGRPMLWHIMKQYAHYGYNDFIICTGYKGEVIMITS